jgi:hypothetical protein
VLSTVAKDYNVKCCFNECVLNFNLCVFSELHTEVSHTTDIVEKRKAYSSFQCKDGTIYKLMGTFVDPKNSKYSDLVYQKIMNIIISLLSIFYT